LEFKGKERLMLAPYPIKIWGSFLRSQHYPNKKVGFAGDISTCPRVQIPAAPPNSISRVFMIMNYLIVQLVLLTIADPFFFFL